ncbi:unnamed protein product, partial [Hapterophycus canaliculatus]
GSTPSKRSAQFFSISFPQVLSYVDVLRGKAEVGRRVAVIGAGGIGFDVSEYLLGEKALETPAEKRLNDVPSFLKEWKIDRNLSNRGG